MAEPMRVNLSGIQAQQAKQEARQVLARQVDSKLRFTEEVEEGFNPAASRRQMERLGRFRTLESRKKANTAETAAIKEIEARAEEDLAHSFERRNPELSADKLATLKQLLNEDQTAEEILAEVLKMMKDPTLADEALEFLDRSFTEPMKSKIKKARELLNEKFGREVLAGRNIDTAAKAFAKKGIQTATELRNLYREVTGDPKPHNALFAQLSADYDFDELKQLVEFLLQGLAYDLKSKGPSIQQAELQLLMTEVRNLQSIVWVYLFFRGRMTSIKRLYEQYGLDFNEHHVDFQKLAKEFVKIAEDRYPSVLKIMRQAEKMGLVDDEEKALILTQFRDAIRQVSPRLYQSARHKQDLLLAVIEALEELEEEEEEEE